MNTTPIQPPSPERDDLVRMLPELVERDLPRDRQRQLRKFMMSEIAQDPVTVESAPRRAPRRRLILATSALAAVAVVAAGIAGFGTRSDTERSTATKPGPTTGRPSAPGPTAMKPSSAAHTFELAAATAAAKPFTPPRPDQWIYIRNQQLAPGVVAKDKGQDPDVIDETWSLADGTKMAGWNPMTGQLNVWEQDNGYPAMCALPTDPKVLLSVLREQVADAPADQDPDALLFGRVASILSANVLPPEVTAALWRAAAVVPGATEVETVEVDGRELIAVGRVQDGWRFEQLLVEPDTYDFVGYRSVAVKNHTVKGAPDGPIRVRKGEVQVEIIRLAAKIVDAPGRTS